MHHLLAPVIAYIRANILIAITLCYVTGGIVSKYLHIDENLIQPFMLALIGMFLFLTIFHRRHVICFLLLPLFICTGFLHTANSLKPPEDPAHLYNLLKERKKVTLTGKILNMPEFDGRKTRFNLDADSILFHNNKPGTTKQKTAKGKIRLSVEGFLPGSFLPGNQVMVYTTASRTYNYQTPGVFDYRLYLADRGIHVSGKIQSPLDVILFQDIKAPWHSNVQFMPEQWRTSISSFLQENLGPDTAGIYQALLIGSRSGIPDATLEQFKATGCMHLLAISGIHMSLLGLMITLALTWIMKRSSWLLLHTHVPTVATLLALLPLTLYAFIAGLNTPVLRSLIMSALFLIGVVLQRQRSILFIVSAAALFLLIFKPLALFTVSFQLSFSSILSIALLYPQLLSKFEQNSFTAGNKISLYISSALLVSLAASLGALPFMLFHFNRFSLVGPVMNLLVEPFLCLWALPIGLLAIPMIFIAPQVAVILLKAGSIGILAADKITLAGSKLSFAAYWTITPDLIEFSIYYLLLFLGMKQGLSSWKKMLTGLCSIIFVLFFTRGLWLGFPSTTTELSFLDVGQGSSTVIEFPSGRTILVDAGSKASPSFNIGERVIGPFLRKKGLWRVDDIIITHPHSDHANGVDFILRHFAPERLWINGDEREGWIYENIMPLAAAMEVDIIKPETDRTISPGPETSLTFLQGAQDAQTDLSVNDRSLIIKVVHGNTSVLLPGDVSSEMERKLIRKGIDMRANLLLAPHHGSRGSASREFITSVNPEIIIVSSGKNSTSTYPAPEHLTHWRNEKRTVLRTSKSGTITCLSDGTAFKIQTFSDQAIPQ